MTSLTVDDLLNGIARVPPFSGVKRQVKKRQRKNRYGFFLFSDWHIGEIITPERTEGFGYFNYAIAKERLDHITDSMLNWASTTNIAKAVLLFLGDYVSGGIHDELLIGAEFPPPVQAVRAGELMAGTIAKFYEACPVDVYALTTDNHGRLTKPVIYKDKGLNNYSYITVKFAQQLVSKLKVNFNAIETIYHQIEYAGKKILMTHGDTIKAWNGIPYYGIDRLVGRESARRNFDFLVLGHFHTPAFVGRTLINGCLTGTSEYSYAAGYNTAPTQLGFTFEQESIQLSFFSPAASKYRCVAPSHQTP